MQTEWRNAVVRARPWMARAALSAAAIMGITIGGSMIPRWITYAQSGPTFEVSPVITAGRAGGTGRGTGTSIARISRTPRRIAFRAALVGNIMAFAYGLPLDRIERRPQWMYDDLYDVAVTTEAPASLPEQKLMLQKLLEERFGLVVHRVSNESPVYFLVPGAKVYLTETKEGDATGLPDFHRADPGLEFSSGLPGGTSVGNHVSMGDLAAWLYPQLQLPVLDKTGITGLFDIEIRGLPIRGGAEGTIRAVRSSLGLDLELHPGTAESLIIDQVKKPEQN
jgi:uncharacterized protein (TIGR03435 family)